MPRKPSPAMLVALLAFVVALGGTAVAAERYVITSTSQIKPSVLAELRVRAHAATVEPVPLVIARARTINPVVSGSEESPVPDRLTGGAWTQGAEELNQVTGEVVATAGPGCGGVSRLRVNVLVSDWNGVTGNDIVVTNVFGRGEHELWNPGETKHFGLLQSGNSSIWPLFEPGKPEHHELIVQAGDSCESGHFTVDSVALDVLGAD
jgi:hypothetical protein